MVQHLRVSIRVHSYSRIDSVSFSLQYNEKWDAHCRSSFAFDSGAGDIAQFLLGYFLVLRKCKEAE